MCFANERSCLIEQMNPSQMIQTNNQIMVFPVKKELLVC